MISFKKDWLIDCVYIHKSDDTALQTQDSKFKPWWAEVEHATSRSRRLPIILNFYEWARKKHFVSLKLEGHSRLRTSYLRLSKHVDLTTAPGHPPNWSRRTSFIVLILYVSIHRVNNLITMVTVISLSGSSTLTWQDVRNPPVWPDCLQWHHYNSIIVVSFSSCGLNKISLGHGGSPQQY